MEIRLNLNSHSYTNHNHTSHIYNDYNNNGHSQTVDTAAMTASHSPQSEQHSPESQPLLQDAKSQMTKHTIASDTATASDKVRGDTSALIRGQRWYLGLRQI